MRFGIFSVMKLSKRSRNDLLRILRDFHHFDRFSLESSIQLAKHCKIKGFLDLQEQGMAWSDKSPHGGISIDGQPGHDYQNNHSSTLTDLGVSDGSVITVMDDITQARL